MNLSPLQKVVKVLVCMVGLMKFIFNMIFIRRFQDLRNRLMHISLFVFSWTEPVDCMVLEYALYRDLITKMNAVVGKLQTFLKDMVTCKPRTHLGWALEFLDAK